MSLSRSALFCLGLSSNFSCVVCFIAIGNRCGIMENNFDSAINPDCLTSMPRTATIMSQLSTCPQQQASLNSALSLAAELGDLPEIRRLVAMGAEPRAHDSQALFAAASQGLSECVKFLIPLSFSKAGNSRALVQAASCGHIECVKLLIPTSWPRDEASRALRLAASEGHVECVRLLIPASNPMARNSCALGLAAKNGHSACVELLIPVSSPNALGSQALFLAASAGRTECLRLLIPVSSVRTLGLRALCSAAQAGHLDCAKLLLQSIRASRNPEVLASAMLGGSASVVAAILESDPGWAKTLSFPALLRSAENHLHRDIASLFSSLIESAALASAAHAPAPFAGRHPARI